MALAIGLMSGTSMDGIDAALVRCADDPVATELVAFHSIPYPSSVQRALRRCQQQGGLEALARLDVAVGELFAAAANEIMDKAGVSAAEVSWIGSHGQTLLHLPEPGGEFGRPLAATLQIGEAAVIAARTRVVTVADFRPADMARGGQGAPLVPWLDWHLFRHPDRHRVLLNIGGVANLTALPAGGDLASVTAFDTGPGNVLIDAAARRRGLAGGIDRNGAVAAAGAPDEDLLAALLADPYYDRPPPRSADAEQFGMLLGSHSEIGTADLLATVTELTARTVGQALDRYLSDFESGELLVAGGGAYNLHLMARLEQACGRFEVRPLEAVTAIRADAKEAVAFALLAGETLAGRAANVPSATGAAGPAILGKVAYPPP